jgi:hypothetical protein
MFLLWDVGKEMWRKCEATLSFSREQQRAARPRDVQGCSSPFRAGGGPTSALLGEDKAGQLARVGRMDDMRRFAARE